MHRWEGVTNSSLDLGPADMWARLDLGRVVENDSLVQNLGLAVAEIPVPQQGHGIRRGAREDGDEHDAHKDGKRPFDLCISRQN